TAPEPPPAGVLALGVALAAGLPAASRIAKSTTPNASAAATTAVTAKSQPGLVPRRPGGGGKPAEVKPAGGYPDAAQACPASPGASPSPSSSSKSSSSSSKSASSKSSSSKSSSSSLRPCSS